MNLCATNLERVPSMERRKRKISEEETISSTFAEQKRPRLVYIRLESESSLDSQDDTESIYSVQDKETDVARDTSDTDSTVDSDSGGELVTLEYDVASLSSDSDDFPDYTSSGTEDMNMQAAAEGTFAAVLLDTSLDAWEADGSTSDGSTIYDAFDVVDVRTDFWKCQLCKSHNDNPSYRYCEKCFQVRKTFFPPRPKPSRKRKHHDESNNQQPVQLDTLQNCLKELKNKGSPLDLPGTSEHIPNLNFKDIVVPQEHLNKHRHEAITSTRSHDVSDHSDSDLFEEGTPRKKKRCKIDTTSDTNSDEVDTKDSLTSKDSLIPTDPEFCSQDSGIGSVKYSSSQESTDNPCCSYTTEEAHSKQCFDDKTNKHLELNVINLKRHTDESQHSDSKSDSGISSKHPFDTDFVQKATNSGIRDGELCIMCSSAPKNGIFLHGGIGHMCCCYKCAMRVWKNCKRCPVCNCKVRNVVKLFTS